MLARAPGPRLSLGVRLPRQGDCVRPPIRCEERSDSVLTCEQVPTQSPPDGTLRKIAVLRQAGPHTSTVTLSRGWPSQ